MDGIVAEIWRYPVKSMGGERLTAAEIGERGLVGDRTFAVLDRAPGTVASAKLPRLWARLLACQATWHIGEVTITLPDGQKVYSADPRCDAQLSAWLEREVTLARTPPPLAEREALREIDGQVIERREPLARAAAGTFFDYAPLHIISQDTVSQIAQASGTASANGRFRPNIVVRNPEHALEEEAWLGASVRIGAALVRCIDPAPRCVVTTLAQAGIPAAPEVLRALAPRKAASVTAAPGVMLAAVAGIYATTQSGGVVSEGDPILGMGAG